MNFSVRTMQLPRILDQRGNLSVFENDLYFPFRIKQVSWMWTSGDSQFTTEAEFVNSSRVIVLLAGQLTLHVSTGFEEYSEIILDKNLNCICVPPIAICKVLCCSSGTLAFLASDKPYSRENSLTQLFVNNEKSVVHS